MGYFVPPDWSSYVNILSGNAVSADAKSDEKKKNSAGGQEQPRRQDTIDNPKKDVV